MRKSFFKTIICLCLCFVLGLTFMGCSKDSSEGVKESSIIKLGEGEYDFRLLVMIDNEIYRTYSIHSDELILGDALENLDLIKVVKDSKKYGTYTKSVAGKSVDIEKEGKFWQLSAEHCPATSNPFVVEIVCGTTYIYEIQSVQK